MLGSGGGPSKLGGIPSQQANSFDTSPSCSVLENSAENKSQIDLVGTWDLPLIKGKPSSQMIISRLQHERVNNAKLVRKPWRTPCVHVAKRSGNSWPATCWDTSACSILLACSIYLPHKHGTVDNYVSDYFHTSKAPECQSRQKDSIEEV